MERIIHQKWIRKYEQYLKESEKSINTITKYLRDVRVFCTFAAGRPISKALVLEYKEYLASVHAITGANSMLAALNSFFRFMEWSDCCVKQYKVQRQAYASEERELTKAEYLRLIKAAAESGNSRLQLILETIGATGMRVSELRFVTAEAIHQGEVRVYCKDKNRVIFLVKKLQKKLMAFARQQGIATGPLFLSRCGKPLDRSSIWRQMKRLCTKAGVSPKKVFPHNLRHLFARAFYEIKKDLAKLADVLGHTNINTTRIYVVTTGAEHRRLLEKMQLVI